MFSLRVFFIFWLSSYVIMVGKVVQAFIRTNLFGEAGEHLSHDSASWNSRDLSDLQPNIHYDDQNHMAHSTYPFGNYHSKQEPEEGFDWGADDIPPQDLWNNHADQPLNFQEAMDFKQGDSWNCAPSEDINFSAQSHQKETYPNAGSSQYQSSSSSTIQPYDADFSDGNYVNSVPHFDDFGYPDSSSTPQPHQNLENPHYNQMTQGPAFHFAQGYQWNRPHLSEKRSNRGYKNHGTTSSSHNSGFTNTDAEIDHWRYLIDRKSLNVAVFKKPKRKKARSRVEAGKSSKKNSELIGILNNEFRKCSKEEVLVRVPCLFPAENMKTISVLGITFMKIIAKKYTKKEVSKEFEDDNSLLHYNQVFWEFCFNDHTKMDEDLRKLFKSIGGPRRLDNTIQQFSTTEFLIQHNTPVNIFTQMASRIMSANKLEIYLYSWYFVFFRTMVYYPELIFKLNPLAGNQLKRFIEDGIMYYYEAGEKF
ncbi:hypothetical protein PPACK8108_LOCUS24839 [Phakopsora pachyrhizi]|uniref:Uncharacterized protein n=1 Tax=Phakopsora pachyrhizi TaxID=170000 RepID=A0AAV0BTY5_PHAPC|nr:hypothetical protein PPACK8108_LOCUS24839 [Phakopsora pachyrhizi]